MRLRDIIARPLIAGPRALGNVLGEALVQPARDPIGIIAMDDEMRDLVPEDIAGEFVSGIADDKEAALRLNSAGPGLEFPGALKLLPVRGFLKNVDVRFRIAGRLLTLELFGHDPIMELCFHRDRRGDEAVDKMVDEMLGLAVFPLL